jgi:hypothetical protein
MSRGEFCKKKLKEAFPGVRDSVLDDITEQMEFFRKSAGSTKEMNDMAQKFYKEYTRQAKISVKNKKVNALKIQEETDFILSEFKNMPEQGLEALVTGVAGPAKGSGQSISSYTLAISQKAFSLLNHGLNTTKLLKIAKSGELDRDIFKISFARRNGLPVPKDVDPRAIELADVYFKVANNLQEQMELAGSQRGRLEGYMGKRTYDGLKVRDMGEEEFINKMMDKLDLQKTFGPQFDDEPFIRAALKEDFENIVLERIDRSKVRAEGSESIAVFNQGSKDKRRSKSRSFQFKDADAEFEIHQMFGKETVMQDVVDMIGRDSRAAAAMHRLGPDFDRNWEAIKSNVFQNVGPEENKRLQSKIRFLDGVFQVTTNGFQTGTSTLAKTTVAAKSLTRMGILGGVVPISAPTDLMTHALNLKNIEGRSLMGSLFQSVMDYTGALRFQGNAREEFFKEMGTYVNNGLGEYHSRFNPDDIVIGKLSQLQDIFFRVSGQTYQSGHWQFANEYMFGKVLAKNVGEGKISPQVEANLARYGIGPEERKLLSGAVKDGRIFMDYVDDLDLPAKAKNDLKLKVGSFLKENSQRISHPAPNERARYMLDLGLDKDTPMGAIFNLMTELKSFPISMLNVTSNLVRNNPDAAGKSFAEVLKTPAGIKTMAQIIVSLTMAGGLGMMARDMSNNRTPQLEDPKFWVKSMLGGGALGLYGDFLLQDYSNAFRSVGQDLAGPVIGGPIQDILSTTANLLYNQELKSSKVVEDFWKRIPGNNLFYTKALLDYYILESMQEAVEPGFKNKKRRNERRRGVEPLF